MPAKASEGFTKAAQKTRFVRNRDIKLKESEERKEQVIRRKMCEGICDKCREKVQWKFHYNKYKPLRNPGVCRDCKQKTITKAYRTICDKCASSKKCCSSCLTTEFQNTARVSCLPGQNEEEAMGIFDEQIGPNRGAGTSGVKPPAARSVASYVVQNISASGLAPKFVPTAADTDGVNNEEDESEEDDEEEEEEEESEESEEEEEDTKKQEEAFSLGNTVFTSAVAAHRQEREQMSTTSMGHWDEKKFTNVAALKYSKSRTVGSDADTGTVHPSNSTDAVASQGVEASVSSSSSTSTTPSTVA